MNTHTYIYNIIVIIIKARQQCEFSKLSFAIRPLLLAGLQEDTRCPHKAKDCKILLIVQH